MEEGEEGKPSERLRAASINDECVNSKLGGNEHLPLLSMLRHRDQCRAMFLPVTVMEVQRNGVGK
jgi:hypothetical protein